MANSNGSVNTGSAEQNSLIDRILLGKYQIERLLGQGGMGAVYQGKHLLLDRAIAIKVIQGQSAGNEQATARFLREAQATAKIQHPNAITIHDFGSLEDNTAYIVMEFIQGYSLRQWLNKHKTVPIHQAVEWVGQACYAIAAAHEKGVIHRDLKPENIMLKEGVDNELIVKVVDFGLAKIVDTEGARLTKTGDIMGTPYYMAPELFDGETADLRADIYALGIIAYELIAGDTPFTGTVQSVIAGHLLRPVTPLRKLNSAIPAALDDAIAQALKKDRAERIGSAIEFAALLKNALTDVDATSITTLDQSSPVSVPAPIPEISISQPAPKLNSRATSLIESQDKLDPAQTFAHPTMLQRPSQENLSAALPTTTIDNREISIATGKAPSSNKYIYAGVAVVILVIGSLAIYFWRSNGQANSGATINSSMPPAVQSSPQPIAQPTNSDPRADSNKKSKPNKAVKKESANEDNKKKKQSWFKKINPFK